MKASLLQANHFKLGSALAEIEKKPKPSHLCNDCISKWKEKVILSDMVLLVHKMILEISYIYIYNLIPQTYRIISAILFNPIAK